MAHCKHRRIWSVSGANSTFPEVSIQSPRAPGVKIEALRIELCENCGRLRIFGVDKRKGPSAWWQHPWKQDKSGPPT